MHVMMQKVLKGNVYAAVVANEAADYLIDKYGYGKLKINGFLVKENMIEGSVAVNSNNPMLFSIIEKTLDDIESQKISEIIKSWRITRYHEKSNYTLAFIILSIAFLVLGLLVYYQRKLQASNLELATTITELNQKEKLLTHQSKQAVMGEMISMIAHQWRQPLSTITLQISNLQLDKLLHKDISPARVDNTLDKISDSIMYLSQTVDDFQTYFAPNKEKTEISIVELLQRVINLDIGRIKASEVQININIDEKTRVNIYINELIQVLLNILNNALDAFENVDEKSKYIDISARLDKEYLYLLVEDNAGGIKEEYLSKLFEPYFSTKGKNGTGLGLYMSQMIIQKQFQGDIEVQSSQKRSTFSIKILRD
jgi:signal transduction histidine kinase